MTEARVGGHDQLLDASAEVFDRAVLTGVGILERNNQGLVDDRSDDLASVGDERSQQVANGLRSGALAREDTEQRLGEVRPVRLQVLSCPVHRGPGGRTGANGVEVEEQLLKRSDDALDSRPHHLLGCPRKRELAQGLGSFFLALVFSTGMTAIHSSALMAPVMPREIRRSRMGTSGSIS